MFQRLRKMINPNTNSVVFDVGNSEDLDSVIIPSLLEMKGNYVVNDPSCLIYDRVAEEMKKNGYKVHLLNLAKETYCPLSYVKEDSDIERFVECTCTIGDFFFLELEKMLLHTTLLYLREYSEINMENIMKVLDTVAENKSLEIFEGLSEHECYKKLSKSANEKVLHPVVISLFVLLSPMERKEPHLIKNDELGKTAVFVVNAEGENEMELHLLLNQKVLAEESKCTYILNRFDSLSRIPNIRIDMVTGERYDISYIMKCEALEQLYSTYGECIMKSILRNSKIVS